MKTTFKTTTILTSAVIAAIFSVAAAFQIPATAPTQATEIASVTVTAKRMSAEQKLAFDLENQEMQTIVISTKRLTTEQKLAMAQEDQAIQAALVRKAARIQTNG